MSKPRDSRFPDRDAIIAFVRASKSEVGTREIARAFGLKNADRVELKQILRTLADEGVLAKRGRKLHEAAALPPTLLADVTGRIAPDAPLRFLTVEQEQELVTWDAEIYRRSLASAAKN